MTELNFLSGCSVQGSHFISFRGTDGIRDWIYGNLYLITNFLSIDNQYSRARKIMQKVFAHFGESNKPIQFFTTGHSLGGGLAQHILYSYPTKITQAIVFDPSSVTGYLEQPLRNQLASCECDSLDLNGEARIYRIYDAYEILSNLRIFHKIFFNPERHVQEIRFPNQRSHSMSGLANYLFGKIKDSNPSSYTDPWYSGKGYFNESKECTIAFQEAHVDTDLKLPVSGVYKLADLVDLIFKAFPDESIVQIKNIFKPILKEEQLSINFS